MDKTDTLLGLPIVYQDGKIFDGDIKLGKSLPTLLDYFTVGQVIDVKLPLHYYGKARVKAVDEKSVSFEGIGPLRRRNLISRLIRDSYSCLKRFKTRNWVRAKRMISWG